MKNRPLFLILLLAAIAPLATQAQTQRDMWDYVTSFRASTGRQQNIACDGQYIYTSTYSKAPENNPPVNSQFYKYDFDGNLIEEFDIAGCDHLRDLTYDGQYFYGGGANNETKLYCVDLANKTLIGSVNVPIEAVRHCSYDPVNDGFWIGTSTSLVRINRQGQLQETVTDVPPTGIYCSGSGYFTDEEGEAHLYMFCNLSTTPYIYDYNITTGVFNTTPELDFTTTPGYVAYGGAGGAFVGEYNGNVCFFGDSPSSPNFIAIYSLGDFTPEPPEPPAGDQFYDFDDAYLQWTTIDADGDGYDWHLNRNWGNTANPYSVVSQSRDEILELPLTPDNYLVSPWKLTYGLITFKACAQDAAYPEEHFGVAISTTGNTDAADFTTIWETTMTAKSQGTWYDFAIDLSEYEGQEIWVALRHFNSSDQFMIVVDDITLYREWDNVEDHENYASTFTIYPNPATNRVSVTCNDTVEHYELYSIIGTLVRRQNVGTKSFSIDVHDLPAGAYLINLHTKNTVQAQRFLKK